jgi:hypothetical protein
MYHTPYSQISQPNAEFPTDSLHRAVYSGSVEEVDGLLERGAIVRATNNLGQSRFFVAVIFDGSQNNEDRIIHHADGFRGRWPKSCVPVCRFVVRLDCIVRQ